MTQYKNVNKLQIFEAKYVEKKIWEMSNVLCSLRIKKNKHFDFKILTPGATFK